MTEREKKHQDLYEILLHAEKCGDWTKLVKLLKDIPPGSTLLKVVQWIEEYSPYVVKFEGRIPTKIERREGVFAIEQGNLNPYWTINSVETVKKKLPIKHDLNSLDLSDAFIIFKKNPNEKNYIVLKQKMDEYRGIVTRNKNPPKIKVRIVQGGIYGLGKSRKH
jgi:hypothetical protein